MSRKIFFQLFLLAAVFSITGLSCRNKDAIPLVNFTLDMTKPEYQMLASIGGTVVVQQYSILVGQGYNGYFAVSSYCTLHNCTLEYQSFSDELKCPCSSCLFSTSGAVVMGPASIPLIQYATQLNGQWLRVYSP